MPLITCPDCGKEHSDEALSCPQCGRPNKSASSPKGQAPIKKRGGCATGCLGFFLVAIVLGAIISGFNQAEQEARIKGCNAGKAEDCEALLDDSSFKDYAGITNKQYSERFSDKSRKAAEVSRSAAIIYACEKSIRDSLRDPDSLKVLSKDLDNLLIEYSATNGFGGRVRSIFNCKTGKSLR